MYKQQPTKLIIYYYNKIIKLILLISQPDYQAFVTFKDKRQRRLQKYEDNRRDLRRIFLSKKFVIRKTFKAENA